MSITGWLNTAWMWKCRRNWRAFQSAARGPQQTQAAVLQRVLAANTDSQWGCQHNFAAIRTPEEFQRRVPVTEYADYETAIERIANGDTRVLTAEPVLLFEPTSGSAGGRKLIPYTASLRREYQRMIGAWIWNLFHERPQVRRGRAYWSISPALGPRENTAGGIPIGFEDDREYLGGWERRLAGRVMAVPPEVARAADVQSFRYQTLLHLLLCRDLSLVSIWSPTFLTALLELLEPQREALEADLRRMDGKRGREVAALLLADLSPAERLRRLWPQLALLSCWADASAEPYAADLQRRLPHVELQPKGLLATEGCVSFPLVDQPGAALALTSHFLEFAELDDVNQPTGDVRLAHQLEPRGRYGVLLTTGGGLYRYRLGDIVHVVGRYQQCPLVRFAGRAAASSDLVGEKLSESHVQAALQRVLPPLGIDPSAALLVPVATEPPRYRLLLGDGSDADAEVAAERLQRELESNPYYRYAVELGQLAPLDAQRLPPGETPWQCFERRRVARGHKLGDVKPAALAVGEPWPETYCSAPLAAQRG